MSWLETANSAGYRIRFRAREVLATARKRDDRLIILLSGSVALIAGGKRVGEVGAGAFIGAESIVDGGNSPFTALAEQAGQALVLDRASAEALIKDSPEFAAQLSAVLAGHVRMLAGEVVLKRPAPKQQDPEPESMQEKKEAWQPPKPEPPEQKLEPNARKTLRGDENIPSKQILPAGHPEYGITAPESWKRLTIEKEITCPICSEIFKDLNPSSYKLRTKAIKPDMRVIYEDFEIIWYSVRVCPHCCAAAPSNLFSRYNSRDARLLKSRGYFKDFPAFSGWSDPRNVDEVFEALYLSLHCIALSTSDIQAEAQIWRRLMWLYEDVGDNERRELAESFTLEKYREVYETRNIIGEEEQQLDIILGDLYRGVKDRQNAYKHYMNVVQLGKSGNQTLYRHATEALNDLRGETL